MSTTIRGTLNTALQLWQEIAGIDPNATSIRVSDWFLRDTFTELNEAIELDPSQVTAILLLAHFAETYLAERQVSMLEMLQQADEVRRGLEKPARLLSLLALPNVVEARESYVAKVAEALASYGAAGREDVQELLGKSHELAVLRRDALRSMKHLRVDQFLTGDPEPEHIRPVYNRTVHQWWNVNSMLAAATTLPSGVSLNLIKHPDAFQSYFCFVVRNGANLYVVTDVPDDAHRLQGSMRRRPDRDLDRRAQRNWFPYSLLDLEYDEESKRLFVTETKRRDLVAYQVKALPLEQISGLQPEVIVWLIMMFDQLVERYWHEGWQAPQLSYTAEMLSTNPLLIAAESANLPALTYAQIRLAPLTRSEVLSEGVLEAEVGQMHDQPNAWMERRYGAMVPDVVFNLLAPPEDTLLLGADGEVERIETTSYLSLCDWQRADLRAGRDELNTMDATAFGSQEKLQADRKFIARANFARHIDRLAQAEYDARSKEVMAWYAERVTQNLPTLLTWAGNTDLWVDEGMDKSFSGYEGHVGRVRNGKRGFVERYEIGSDTYGYRFAGSYTPARWRRGEHLCLLNDTKASFYVVFAPATAYELALLAGCAVEELPDVLQHWSLLRPYRGNSILNRIDPMVWNVANPWQGLDLRVRLPLSKRAMSKVLKDPVVEPLLLNRCGAPK